MNDSQWAMLATAYEAVEHIDYPVIGQPKLNGIRAKWTGRDLVSRQGKIWNRAALPHIYDKLSYWSERNPNVILDGELYCHGLPFQEIEARAAVKRVSPHADCGKLDFHAFDIISDLDTESRQIKLSQCYKPWVAVCKISSQTEQETWLKTFVEYGYEGLMLRYYGCSYRPGRTTALIKVKPLHYAKVTVMGCYEGLGKFKGMLGGFNVRMGSVAFNVGGGNITEIERGLVWQDRKAWIGREIFIAYRDTFSSGKPVQAQIFRLS